MCCPTALAAEKQGISDERPYQFRILTPCDLAKVCLAVTIIAASARPFTFFTHGVHLDVCNKALRDIIIAISH